MKIVLVVLLSLTFLASAKAQSPGSEVPDKDLHQRKPSKNSGLPVVGEFQRQPESDADEGRRQKREKLYENSAPRLLVPYGDPGALADGSTESTHYTFLDTISVPLVGVHQDLPGIPVTGAAVIIGTILSGNSFMSKNRTAVYSDYHVRVDEVLKQGPTATLAVGDQVVASRPGGAIHFPSGHRTNFLLIHHGLPEIGSQYILYLFKTLPNLPEYEIGFESGYLVKNGRVFALDDVNEQFYEGMSEPVFLDTIKKAIVASQQNGGKTIM
jgi:hypothetical protein